MENEEWRMENCAMIDMHIESRPCNPAEWAMSNKDAIEAVLREKGALLVRGLRMSGSKEFAKVLTILFDSPLLEYVYRSTPRTELKYNVYTATEYPNDQCIPQHNENAYAHTWPLRIAFWCVLPAALGGETPIADSQAVYEKIPSAIRSMFEEKGVRYVRNYSDVDLPWTEVFQTESREEVEQYCVENRLAYEWYGENALRTMQINAAVQAHPDTGRPIWFNQAHLFHEASLPEGVKEGLLSSFGRDKLPRTALFGDGSRIDDETIGTIATIYESEKQMFAWEKGDLLLLDNMRYTHGRMPFEGDRIVLVGMAKPYPN